MYTNVLFTIFVILCFTTNLAAQKKSEWKIFAHSYVVDEGTYVDYTNQVKTKLNTNNINDVAVSKQGEIYIATENGLYSYINKKLARVSIKDVNLSACNAIEFDHDDNLWIGAIGGLVKKGATSTQIFTKETYPDMAIARALEIIVDANNNIWITGRKDLNTKQGAGISFFDGAKWTNYQDAFEKPFVEDLCLDANGNVWVVYGRQDDGVAMFDGSQWNFFNKSNSPLPTNTVRAIASDKNGKVYLGTELGLSTYENGEWSKISLTDVFKSSFLTKFMANFQPVIVSLAVDQNNILWIGTKENGVYRVNGDSKVEITKDNSPLTSNSIRRILVDQNNAKWFLTGYRSENITDEVLNEKDYIGFAGAVMYKEPDYTADKNWEVHNYYTKSLPALHYYQVALDKNNDVYLTSSQGLLQYKNETWTMINEFSSNFNSPEIVIAKDQTIWTSSSDITKMKDGNIEKWNKKDAGLGGMNAGLALDQDGKLWFGNNDGICNFKDGQFSCISKKEGLPDTRINYVYVDAKNNLWAGFYASVGKFDGSTWVEYSKKVGGLEGTYPSAILERANGEIWVGNEKGIGVTKDLVSWEMKEIPKDYAYKVRVNCMAQDAEGNVFIGTKTAGMFVLTKDGEWVSYNSENSGLPSNEVTSVVVGNGGLWVVSSVGEPVKTFTSQPYTAPGGTTPTVDPMIAIQKKIDAFDPNSAISFFTF